MLTQTILSVSLFLILMLECARLYLGVQGNLNEKVRDIYFFVCVFGGGGAYPGLPPKYAPLICFKFQSCLFYDIIDSGFSSILDVFVDPPITSTIGILVPEQHARRNCSPRYNVPFTLVAARLWVRGPA